MAEEQRGLTYRDAGVNIDAQDEALRNIKDIVRKTFDERVLQDIGSFGAMYDFSQLDLEQPVLVSSVDSVGTKLKVAFMMNKHDTVGIDIVSHCANDILVQGARPLFVLDYIGCGGLDPAVITEVIRGVATGCRYAGCALIGGELAELPEMYHPGEYDLVATIVGVVERKRLVDGSKVVAGDAILGLPSSGLHTNGYTLARKVCFGLAGLSCSDPMPGVGRTVGEALLEPHRSYVKVIQLLMRVVTVKGMAHITGGGVTDNLPRTLPEGLGATIDLNAWVVPPLFKFIHETGRVADLEMMRTFNMGMGFLIVVSADEADKAMDALCQAGEKPCRIGTVVPGERKVSYAGRIRYGE